MGRGAGGTQYTTVWVPPPPAGVCVGGDGRRSVIGGRSLPSRLKVTSAHTLRGRWREGEEGEEKGGEEGGRECVVIGQGKEG